MKSLRNAVSTFRLRPKPMRDDIQHRVDDISKQFTGAGWKNLPQELIDEILGYLLDDLGALKACSLTCRHLFGATRPLIHRRFRLVLKPDWVIHSKPKRLLFGRLWRRSKVPERSVDVERLGLLRYALHLTLMMKDRAFDPADMQECLPHPRPITKLHTLTLDTFHAYLFVPVFDECLGIFANTLRHLDVREAYGTYQELLYIISQFPLLEDLTIVSPTQRVTQPEPPVPVITQSPPLRGNLVLAEAYSEELFEGLVAFPDGLHFRSLELFRCETYQAILAACSHTVASISYLWDVENSANMIPLDLKQNVVLERFEFNIHTSNLLEVHQWIHQTLRTITSPLFNEFVFATPYPIHLWDLLPSDPAGNWRVVDASLNALAERNPDFRVTFKGYFPLRRSGGGINYGVVRWFAEGCLPVVLSKGLVKFENVPTAENRFWKSRILQTLLWSEQ